MELFTIRDRDESTVHDGLRHVLFYEVWEPTIPRNLVRVYAHEANGSFSWGVGPPYENFFGPTPNPQAKEIGLEWEKGGPVIPLPAVSARIKERKEINRWEVAVRIRAYTKEQHKKPDHPLSFPVIQYYCDMTIFWDDLFEANKNKGAVDIEGVCASETRWVNEKIIHQRFSLSSKLYCLTGIKMVGNSPLVHWTGVLRKIWNKYTFNEHEIKGFMLTGSPLSLPLEGSPFRMGLRSAKDPFDCVAGLPSQSAWILKKDASPASEEWYETAMKQVLVVRGQSLKDFCSFIQGGMAELGLLHDYQVSVVRALTLFQTTHPYVGDYRFDSKWERVSADATVVQLGATLGDCEDTAIGTYMLAVGLLRKQWPPGSVVQGMQKVLAVMGVPVGISGRGRDPNCRLEPGMSSKALGVCHMYTIIVPFPILWKALSGKEPSSEQYKWLSWKFGVEEELVKREDQCAVMETTIMATAFYHDRDKEEETVRKEHWRQRIKDLIKGVRDDPLSWMNYTTPHPLSCKQGDTAGELVHTRAYRMFTFGIQEFLDGGKKVTVELYNGNRQEVNLFVQGSFVVHKAQGYKHKETFKPFDWVDCDLCHRPWSHCTCGAGTIGVDTETLFGKQTLSQLGWKLKCNYPISDEVFQAEQQALDQFQRPIQEMTVSGFVQSGMVADPCLSDKLPETLQVFNQLKDKFLPTVHQNEKSDKRIMVYAWRLVKEETERLMTTIKQLIKAKEVTMTPYGNGYAFVFHF